MNSGVCARSCLELNSASSLVSTELHPLVREQRNSMTPPPERTERLSRVLFSALLGPSQLFLFGPFTVYHNNPGEFSVPFSDLIGPLLLALLVSVSALVGLGFVVSRRWFPAYVAVLFGFGVLLWLQGNLLVGNYGLLEADAIDFDAQAWRGPWEIGLWVGALLLLASFAHRVIASAPLASQLLIVLQALSVVVLIVQSGDELDGHSAQWDDPPQGLYEFSTKQNVIHIVLDAFQSDVFREIVEEDRARFDRELDGFVFFSDHAGVFPTTSFAIPAMLTGSLYRNEGPVREFLQDAFEQGSVLNGLARNGYEVDVVSIMRPSWARDWLRPQKLADGSPSDEPVTNYFRLARSFTTHRVHRRLVAAFLVDLSFFRHLPHPFKPWVYNEQAWRLRSAYSPDLGHTATSARDFLEDFVERVRVSREAPVYKFLHLGIPHRPVVLGSDCSFVDVSPVSRSTFRGQAECAVNLFAEFLNRLRRAGIYDSSLIIVSSDHGTGLEPPGLLERNNGDGGSRGVDFRTRIAVGEAGVEMASVVGTAMALLLVKPPAGGGGLTLSTAPTSTRDIPATVFDLLGFPHEFPGEPAFNLEPDAARTRTYSVYNWRDNRFPTNYFERLDIFSIDGKMLNAADWSYRNTIFAPDHLLAAETIDVGTRSARPHLGEGWGKDETEPEDDTTFVWAVGDRATVYTSLPHRSRELMSRLRSPRVNDPQVVEVEVDGRSVGKWEPAWGSYRELSLLIPEDQDRPQISSITFRFTRDRRVGAQPPGSVKFDRVVIGEPRR